ncbi:MAG: hypothetical protein WCT42_01540 [Candidatus Paceibacterota bacterium]
MENKDISQIALQRIKESGIKPISKNIFSLKRVIFWSLVGFSIVVGAVSFSVIISLLFNNDWYLYQKFGLNFIVKTIPYFWFVFLAVFTILGDYYYRKTFLGYRHRTITIVCVYIVITIVAGSTLNIIGTGKIIEESLRDHVPMYRGFIFDKDEFWSHPENGLLSGKIIGIKENLIQIIDSNGIIWIIDIDSAFVGGRAQIKIGETIKIIGDIDENNIFTVEQVRPWIGNKNNIMR